MCNNLYCPLACPGLHSQRVCIRPRRACPQPRPAFRHGGSRAPPHVPPSDQGTHACCIKGARRHHSAPAAGYPRHVQGPGLPVLAMQWHFIVIVTPAPRDGLHLPVRSLGVQCQGRAEATATVMTATDAWRWDMPTDVHGQGQPWNGWVCCPPTNQPTWQAGPRLGRWWAVANHRPPTSSMVLDTGRSGHGSALGPSVLTKTSCVSRHGLHSKQPMPAR